MTPEGFLIGFLALVLIVIIGAVSAVVVIVSGSTAV